MCVYSAMLLSTKIQFAIRSGPLSPVFHIFVFIVWITSLWYLKHLYAILTSWNTCLKLYLSFSFYGLLGHTVCNFSVKSAYTCSVLCGGGETRKSIRDMWWRNTNRIHWCIECLKTSFTCSSGFGSFRFGAETDSTNFKHNTGWEYVILFVEIQVHTFTISTSLVVYWSAFVTMNCEVPGSISVSTLGIFPW
jgi:hypothetical protein